MSFLYKKHIADSMGFGGSSFTIRGLKGEIDRGMILYISVWGKGCELLTWTNKRLSLPFVSFSSAETTSYNP